MMRIVRAQGVFWDVVDSKTVVCDIVSGELYRLNDIAAFLWDACDKTSVESLTARLAAAYPDQDIERLAMDVSRFVDSMLAKHLLIASA
jgi:Coenzyme PQQ synthesis protein D (PqqD)